MSYWSRKTQQRQMYRSQVLGAEDYNMSRLARKVLVGLAGYLNYRRCKEIMASNAEIHRVNKLQDRALRGLIWYLCQRKEKVRK